LRSGRPRGARESPQISGGFHQDGTKIDLYWCPNGLRINPPGKCFVDSCSISQTGAVRQAPGPNFGPKIGHKPNKLKYLILPYWPPYWPPLAPKRRLLVPKRRLHTAPHGLGGPSWPKGPPGPARPGQVRASPCPAPPVPAWPGPAGPARLGKVPMLDQNPRRILAGYRPLSGQTWTGPAGTDPCKSVRVPLPSFRIGNINDDAYFGFWQVSARTWPRDPFQRVGLEKGCRTHPKLAPETNYKTVS
jgi:hypothetical protein